MLRVVLALGSLMWMSPWDLGAQQRLEIDHSSGRTVVNNVEYAFREISSIDHQARLIYVVDASEPLAAMAFALDDGRLLATLGGRQGEGPGELRNLVDVAAIAGGVLVADHTRVLRWRIDGSLADVWTPNGPPIPSLCSLQDAPAVPLPGGVIRQMREGPDLILGSGQLGTGITGTDLQSARAAAFRFAVSKTACIEDVAYVLDERLSAVSMNGTVSELPIPAELEERSKRAREAARRQGPGRFVHPYSGLYGDGKGNLLITRWASSIAGALVDPETGCYSLLVDSQPLRSSRRLVGMYQDSAVILESPTDVQTINGKPRTVVYADEASVIALRPLRLVGVDPCPMESESLSF